MSIESVLFVVGKVISRESTLGSRSKSQKEIITPGPGEYEVDKLDKSKLLSGGAVRGYTFGHRSKYDIKPFTPGKLFQSNLHDKTARC